MAEEDVIERLDTMISILRLAHQSEIDIARQKILAEDGNAEILDLAAANFVAAGELKAKVGKKTKQSAKTVQRRIADLVAIGALEKRTSGSAAYRSTGLI